MSISKTIAIENLGRVEGHGGVHIVIRDGKIQKVNMDIFEGSRFYEVLILGKHFNQISSIVSRVCGICSAGHTLTSQMATERALGIEVSQRTEFLRGLLIHGELIESHALHLACLVLPDLLGYDGPLAMAKDYAKEVSIGLAIKKLGNRIQELIGGRAIHPINAIIGGFGKIPTEEELKLLQVELERGLEHSQILVDLLASLKLPENPEVQTTFAALEPKEQRYSYLGEVIQTSDGKKRSIEKFREVCNERTVSHSTAKQSLYNNQPFMVGALARINLNERFLTGKAKEAQARLLPVLPSYNILHNNYAQMIELMHSIERALTLINYIFEEGLEEEKNGHKIIPKAGKGVGAIEVPRGTLYHYYEFDKDGILIDGDIITPTAQNLANVEQDMYATTAKYIGESPAVLRQRLETVVRAYDPCISCSTHFVEIDTNNSIGEL